MVVADVDGTLLDWRHVVDDRVKFLVKRVAEQGRVFTLATGRIFASARQVAKQAGVVHPIIANGGALIGTPDGRELWTMPLSRRVALDILRNTVPCPGARYAFVHDTIYTDTPGEHVQTYEAALGVRVCIVSDLADVLDDDPTQVVLRVPVDEAPALADALSRSYARRAKVIRSLPHLIEFLHPEASKGTALVRLCRILGIDLEEVLAIGDGESDLDMLSVAGMGAMVANAPEPLKSFARYVSRAPFADGVAEAIDHFSASD